MGGAAGTLSGLTAGTASRQTERSAATRARLVKAARELFSQRPYADVGTEEIVRRARVTRGDGVSRAVARRPPASETAA